MGKIETLTIDKEFSDFNDFYDESKDAIYRKILESFEEIELTNEDINLIVSAKILDTQFESNFQIKKSNFNLLMKSLNPYFESIEDYETCQRVLDLYEKQI